MIVALLWGFAEATFFFLVPDVWLSYLAIEDFTEALYASFASLAGALAGGALMWRWGRYNAPRARAFVAGVPAIGDGLVKTVAGQLSAAGFAAVMKGPLLGIPYKIYAVESGAQGRSLAGFLLISIPARYFRFLFAIVAFALAARYLLPFGLHGKRIAVTVFWVGFYLFYFRKFGWRGASAKP